MADSPFIHTDATSDGIIVKVSLNGDHATSGLNQIAAHRPTRYALMMRRTRANAARKAHGVQQLPAIMAGDCQACAGLGVVEDDRRRCPRCKGSGER